MTEKDFDNSRELGPQAKGLRHLETPFRRLSTLHLRRDMDQLQIGSIHGVSSPERNRRVRSRHWICLQEARTQCGTSPPPCAGRCQVSHSHCRLGRTAACGLPTDFCAPVIPMLSPLPTPPSFYSLAGCCGPQLTLFPSPTPPPPLPSSVRLRLGGGGGIFIPLVYHAKPLGYVLCDAWAAFSHGRVQSGCRAVAVTSSLPVTGVERLRVALLVRFVLCIHSEGVPVGVWNSVFWGWYTGFSVVHGMFGRGRTWLVSRRL